MVQNRLSGTCILSLMEMYATCILDKDFESGGGEGEGKTPQGGTSCERLAWRIGVGRPVLGNTTGGAGGVNSIRNNDTRARRAFHREGTFTVGV